MTNDEIRTIALAAGFTLREQPDGSMDLNPYVYDFARALLRQRSEMAGQRGHKDGETDRREAIQAMAMAAITMEEVADQYRRALRGEIPVRLEDPKWTWSGSYCGDVGFMFGDWKVVFFNDCDELDYTDSVASPDGRMAEFDDWCSADFTGCPLNLLSAEEYAALEDLVEQAT